MLDPNTQRYAIDVRLFLATMTTAMVLAFGVGVSFAPPALDAPALFDAWVPVSITDRPEEHIVRTKEFPNLHDAESPYEPSGQHLLVDIKGIDADFLDSEERLAKAMVDAVKAGGLSMLSYHCHKLVPMGVSCVGVLLESHISFHTWPVEGVITLDLFTCGPTPLLSVVPEVERLFAIGENTKTSWSHELRGFHLNATKSPEKRHLLEQSDLVFWVLSPLDIYKKEIVSTRTRFQKVDIWETIYPEDTISHDDAVEHNLQPGDPRWLTGELVAPDKMLFLDGTLQSLNSTERVYHEALVHPAMFAHPNPKHIGLIGGGEGATLREILKHNTVESATMIELDEELVSICREHLPEFSNCKNLKGRAENCFDDELVSVVYQDSKEWFIERFGPSPAKTGNKFDVLIIDALDPEDGETVSEELYGDGEFLTSLISSLTEDGIMIIQVGTAPTIYDPRADMGVYASREKMFNFFEDHEQVEAMLVYEEDGCGFLEPHSFLVVCKSAKCRGEWLRESDLIEYAIFNRTIETVDGERLMVQFDGATMQSYNAPPKAWETVYCRREPQPFECAYRALDSNSEFHDYVFDDEKKGTKETEGSFEVIYDDETDEKPIGVEVLKDIPKGSYIMPHQMTSSFIINEGSLNNLRDLTEDIPDVKVITDLVNFIDTHGHGSVSDGIGRTYVELGVSILIEKSDDEDKINLGRWFPGFGKRPVYSPVYDRQFLSLDLFLVATQDIKKGQRLYRPNNLWDFEK
mmetsp:Transcript_10317/g.15166  ORF Transcript_10317/g.15166 Transcript_10317/m.15166 type:complete len:748 (-) Transcript_10317:198-2441(-)